MNKRLSAAALSAALFIGVVGGTGVVSTVSTTAAHADTTAPGTVVEDQNFDGQTSLPAGWTAATTGWSVADDRINETSTDDVRVVDFGSHINNFQFDGDFAFTGAATGWAAFGLDVNGQQPSWQVGIKRHDPDPDTLDFSYHSAGGEWESDNTLAGTTAPFTLANDQVVHVEVDVHGQTGVLYINGQQLLSYDHIQRTSTGTFGLLVGGGATGYWDNIKITALAGFNTDDYTTDPVVAGGQSDVDVSTMWNGSPAPTGFTKVAGDDWLNVSSDGKVTGTAPVSAVGSSGTITVQATDGTTTADIIVTVPVITNPGDFIVHNLSTPAQAAGGQVNQALAGLWEKSTPTGFTKVSGASWLSVSPSGVVTGTVPKPAPKQPGFITVQGTNGVATDTITVEVPVLAAGQLPAVTAASWNLWDNGSHVDGSFAKELTAITGSGLDVIGVQESGGAGAKSLADALGWYSYQSSGDLGIVSAYPISDVTAPTTATPAAGVTITVGGENVRVWTAHLDETTAATAATQAAAIATELAPDLAKSATTPVVLLGDLVSPTAAGAFTKAGLTDAGAAVRSTAPTFSLVAAGGASTRADYVDYRGALSVAGAEAYYTGWPSATDVTSNAWPSDHAAAVAELQLRPTSKTAPR